MKEIGITYSALKTISGELAIKYLGQRIEIVYLNYIIP